MGAAPSHEETSTPTQVSQVATKSNGEVTQKPIFTPATTDVKTKPHPPTSAVTKAKDVTTKPDPQPPAGLTKAKDAVTKAVTTSVKETKEVKKKIPHMFEGIIKQAEDNASNLLDRVKQGVYLNNKHKKYWVDEKTGCNCFMLFARDLLITWSENSGYWQWIFLKDNTSDAEIEIASLLNVCWLEIHGKFEMSYLNPGTVYEIVFVVMMEVGYGWATPVNLRLKLSDGKTQQHKESLLEKPKGQWIELKAGEFTAEIAGQVEFSLFEYEGGQWKKGMIVKGAIIRPKK